LNCHRLAGTEVTDPAIPSSHDGTRWLRHAYREKAPIVRGRGYFTWACPPQIPAVQSREMP
jgi:hypothetical protein